MPRTATFHTRKLQRGDGRELVIFESIVAFLALLLIISGFILYIGHTFNAQDEIRPSGAVKVSTQLLAEPPLSLVEA
jgi:hypothetical protein